MNQLEEEFFNRLRSRVIDADNHGSMSALCFTISMPSRFFRHLSIRCGEAMFLMLKTISMASQPTPMTMVGAVEFFTAPSSGIRSLQKSFVMKVIDTVNDLDNVIFEIGNEVGAMEWQYEMICRVNRLGRLVGESAGQQQRRARYSGQASRQADSQSGTYCCVQSICQRPFTTPRLTNLSRLRSRMLHGI